MIEERRCNVGRFVEFVFCAGLVVGVGIVIPEAALAQSFVFHGGGHHAMHDSRGGYHGPSHFSFGYSYGHLYYPSYGYNSYGHYGYPQHYGHHGYYNDGYGHHRYYDQGHHGYNYGHSYERSYEHSSVRPNVNRSTRVYRGRGARGLNYAGLDSPSSSVGENRRVELTRLPNLGACSRLNCGAWQQLAAGDYDRAYSSFAAEIVSDSENGLLKVGYALSVAGRGDLRHGVWAMRRALRIDAEGLGYIHINARLKSQIGRLVLNYGGDDRVDPSAHADSAFMTASLYYLLGDMNRARRSIDRAIARGDHSPSASNLSHLIAARSRDNG